MKIKLPEIVITITLSAVVWMYLYYNSLPLDQTESLVVVGVILLVVYIVGFIIRRLIRKKNEKN